MILALVLPAALAAEWSLGLQAGLAKDMSAVAALEDPTAFGAGPALLIPLRWTPRPGASWRFALEGSRAGGTDRVVWTDGDTGYYSDEDDATYGALRLLTGPELAFVPSSAVTPYLGVGVGGGVVATHHTFDGAVATLGEAGDTRQTTAAAGTWLGLHAGRKVALEIEAGYCVSFLPQAPLRDVPEALEASRTAWSLDPVRLSAGVSFPL